MVFRRTSHAVYDTQYHLVWAPKYRKWILRGDLREFAHQVFHRIAEEFDFVMEEMELAPDHVHLFLSFPPRYSIAKTVGILKSISTSQIFRAHPEVKRELWGGQLWEDGYYIQYHRQEEKRPSQLDLFGEWHNRNRGGEAMNRAESPGLWPGESDSSDFFTTTTF